MLRMGKFSEVPHIIVTIAILATFVVTLVIMPVMMYANDAKLRRHVVKTILETPLGSWLGNT